MHLNYLVRSSMARVETEESYVIKEERRRRQREIYGDLGNLVPQV